jgi:hypothetical protein
MQLAAASFSSSGVVKKSGESLPEFIISVSSGEQVVDKKTSKLSTSQIHRLFEIFVEEQMNLEVLRQEDPAEREKIDSVRQQQLQRWGSKGPGEAKPTISSPKKKKILASSVSAEAQSGGLFNFSTFIHELSENPEKKTIIEKMERYYPGILAKPLKAQNWFLDYIALFTDGPDYLVPEELAADFDWELLLMLVAGSFSSDVMLGDRVDGTLEVEIAVNSGDQTIIKRVSELWGFQILRLYEIYVEEQLNLQILIAEDPKEKEAILTTRAIRKQRWDGILTRNRVEELALQ